MVFSVNRPVFVSFLVVVILSNLQSSALITPQVPCFFIFGDSLVDNGNNNQLNTSARANYFPYGVDYPGRLPTGRFTNGRNSADFIAEFLGFDSFIPPFATAQGNDFVTGVNYASGSAGIRDETGEHLGDRISISRQLANHNVSISRVSQLLGSDSSAKDLLNKCVYYFVVGNNDYLNNYYLPDYYSTSKTYTTTEEYATVLIQQYSHHLQTLYHFGAKRFAVSALGPLGCIPQEVSQGTGCAKSINEAVRFFNDKLKLIVDELNNNFTDAKFVYTTGMDIVPSRLVELGVQFVSEPCCKVLNTTGQCIPGTTPCPIRLLRPFFDNFHPTELVHKLVADAAYVDIRKLIISY